MHLFEPLNVKVRVSRVLSGESGAQKSERARG